MSDNRHDDYTMGALAADMDTVKIALVRIEGHLEKVNGRVGRLERWRAFLLGAWAVLGLIVAFVVGKR